MKSENRLLLDLLALLERYSPEDWETAIRQLRDTKFRKRFFSVLDVLATLSKEKTAEKALSTTKNATRREREANLLTARAEKFTTPQLKALLKENKVNFSSKDGRQRLLQKLLQSKHAKTLLMRQDRTGNYEDWVNIIMRRK